MLSTANSTGSARLPPCWSEPSPSSHPARGWRRGVPPPGCWSSPASSFWPSGPPFWSTSRVDHYNTVLWKNCAELLTFTFTSTFKRGYRTKIFLTLHHRARLHITLKVSPFFSLCTSQIMGPLGRSSLIYKRVDDLNSVISVLWKGNRNNNLLRFHKTASILLSLDSDAPVIDLEMVLF